MEMLSCRLCMGKDRREYTSHMSRWILLLLVLLIGFLKGCSKKEAPRPAPNSSDEAQIRAIDFRNFDYPKIPGTTEKQISLRNGIHPNLFRDEVEDAEADSVEHGRASLDQVLYGYDDQGKPMAFVVLEVWSGGTWVSSEIFLYTMVDRQPRLQWSFESGDRADGGLRNIYTERGYSVLEFYQELNGPLCCASHFERHFYGWKEGKFVKLGKEEEIPLPKMPRSIVAHTTR
jgi:hypothetical protein